MNEVIFKSLHRYFNHLNQVGYLNYHTVDKIIALIAIEKMLSDELMALMFSDCDLKLVEKVLYKIYGSECVIPFPYDGTISKEKPEMSLYPLPISSNTSNLSNKVITLY